jgi:hypothetical protein
MAYKITEEQWQAIARALDAATLVSAAAPAHYSRTPMGNLMDLISTAKSALLWSASHEGPDDRG